MTSNPYNICLDTQEGTKYLFSNRDAMEQEFFSVPPGQQWFAVSFPTKEEAERFLRSGHNGTHPSIFIGGPV
jgi:hypothetical protein